MTHSNLYLTLAAELTAGEVTYAQTSSVIVDYVNRVLEQFSKIIGGVQETRSTSRAIGQSIREVTYTFTLGSHRFDLHLVHFLPINRWEIKSFQLAEK